MKVTIRYTFILLVLLSLGAIIYRFLSPEIYQLLGYKAIAGLKITSTPSATVLINGKEVGKTPYEDSNLEVGRYKIILRSEDASWQSQVVLNKGTVTVINRDISSSPTFSSGEVLSLLPGKGLIITSNPSDAIVEVDGRERGRTPLTLNDVSTGEHTFILKHDSFLPRSIRASIPDKLLLSMSVDLAVSEGLLSPSPTLAVSRTVTVKTTPTGFLRVRETPSLNGSEITRVNSGDKLTLLEEKPGWDKVSTSDGKEGYVSSEYIQK